MMLAISSKAPVRGVARGFAVVEDGMIALMAATARLVGKQVMFALLALTSQPVQRSNPEARNF